MAAKVSVVIPVFNRPAAVRRAIESVLAQTCQDFEIVVVDDGSTDTTVASVAALADPRITVIRHERNRGGSAARNTGIAASSAPYVAFLDSDDEWLPTKLERQLTLFEQSGERLGLVYSGTERVFADGSMTRSIPRRQLDVTRALLTDNVVGETSVGMVRRSVLQETGGFDDSLPASQDMDLWLRICERFNADYVPEVLVRVTKGNDRGRISTNVVAGLTGREMFRHKHREKLVRHGMLHIHLRESGWWSLREARDAPRARRYYLESLAARPVAPLTYLQLLVACLPMSWLDRLAGWKQELGGQIRSGSQGSGSGKRDSAAPNPGTAQ